MRGNMYAVILLAVLITNEHIGTYVIVGNQFRERVVDHTLLYGRDVRVNSEVYTYINNQKTVCSVTCQLQ